MLIEELLSDERFRADMTAAYRAMCKAKQAESAPPGSGGGGLTAPRRAGDDGFGDGSLRHLLEGLARSVTAAVRSRIDALGESSLFLAVQVAIFAAGVAYWVAVLLEERREQQLQAMMTAGEGGGGDGAFFGDDYGEDEAADFRAANPARRRS